jgi:hypothetical protein
MPVLPHAHRRWQQHQPFLPELYEEARHPACSAETELAHLPWHRAWAFVHPYGQGVLFGEKGNSRREPIWFEVVDISSPYHALLGRPALAKFMAVPHYAYLKMKLLGPRGVIIVSGSFKKSLACTKESSQLAEALVIAEEKRQLLHRVELAQQDLPVRQSPVEQFKPTDDTKKILLDKSDPSKYIIIGTGLSAK